MRTILRMGLSVMVATVLAVTAAWAVDYDDIFELTERGVAERTIIQLIVDDGRAFDMSEDELADLRAAGVSENVIRAMLDPAVGRAFLNGESYGGGSGGGGYSTSLDEAYQQGYNEGVSSTALVFSFGYYYGPLARYYYNDPFYYPFWYSGYACGYWPSYYSYWYRPYYPCYYAYPYNYYGYSSYYCHSYYDPGYWAYNGYYTQPGYGRTVWDNGPRFRGGGIVPPKGGRPDGSSARMAEGSAGRLRNPSGPPAIREAELSRNPTKRGNSAARVESGSRSGGSSSRDADAPGVRRLSSRSSGETSTNGARVIRGNRTEAGSRSGQPTASASRSSTGRTARSERVSGSEPRRLRDSADRVMRGGRSSSVGRTARRESPGSARVIRSSGRDQVADGRTLNSYRTRGSGSGSRAYSSPGRGRSAASQGQGRGTPSYSRSAPSSGSSRGGGGGSVRGGGGGGGSRGGGGGSAHGGGSRGGGGGGGSHGHGGGGGGRGR